MSVFAADQLPARLADPVGVLLEQLASELRSSCLLEDTDGRVLSHALHGEAAPSVVTAILNRTAAPLHRAMGAARQLGVVDGKPVLGCHFTDHHGSAQIVPVAEHGWLWVMSQAGPHDVANLESVVYLLRGALDRITCRATDEQLLAQLMGTASSLRAVDQDEHLVVVHVLGDRPPSPRRLDTALRTALGAGRRLRCTASGDTAYLVLRAEPHGGDVGRRVTSALASAEAALGCRLAAVHTSAGADLSLARQSVDRAIAARAEPGRCLTLDDCRPHVTVDRLLEVLKTLPPLGADPLLALDDEPHLLGTLRAWLDHHGDIPRGAQSLDVHVNTFRYRLRRALDLVPSDTNDPVARLDLHLRLIARVHEEGLA